MAMIRNVAAKLGPREVVIGGKVLTKVDDIIVWVEESTEEELAALKETPVILLLKPLPSTKEKEET